MVWYPTNALWFTLERRTWYRLGKYRHGETMCNLTGRAGQRCGEWRVDKSRWPRSFKLSVSCLSLSQVSTFLNVPTSKLSRLLQAPTFENGEDYEARPGCSVGDLELEALVGLRFALGPFARSLTTPQAMCFRFRPYGCSSRVRNRSTGRRAFGHRIRMFYELSIPTSHHPSIANASAFHLRLDEGLIGTSATQPSFIKRYGLKDESLTKAQQADLKGNITSMVQMGSIAGALIAFLIVDRIGRLWATRQLCILWVAGIALL